MWSVSVPHCRYVVCGVIFILDIVIIVAGVEMFRETLEKAEAGDNCGVLIKGVKRNEIRRGQILCKPGTCQMHNNIEAQVTVL